MTTIISCSPLLCSHVHNNNVIQARERERKREGKREKEREREKNQDIILINFSTSKEYSYAYNRSEIPLRHDSTTARWCRAHEASNKRICPVVAVSVRRLHAISSNRVHEVRLFTILVTRIIHNSRGQLLPFVHRFNRAPRSP